MPPTRLPQKCCMNEFSILGMVEGGAHFFEQEPKQLAYFLLAIPVGRTVIVLNKGFHGLEVQGLAVCISYCTGSSATHRLLAR